MRRDPRYAIDTDRSSTARKRPPVNPPSLSLSRSPCIEERRGTHVPLRTIHPGEGIEKDETRIEACACH